MSETQASSELPSEPTAQPGAAGMTLPASIRLVEVGLRDGLQGTDVIVDTDVKVETATRLLGMGFHAVEVGSFARPDVLPQLADSAEVISLLDAVSGTSTSGAGTGKQARKRALVPNLRGAQRAADCALDEWVMVIPVDETVSRLNQNRTVEQLLTELEQVAALARSTGVHLVVAVACAFFAPGSGSVPLERTLAVVDRCQAVGVDGVYLACTTGEEQPVEVYRGAHAVSTRFPELDLGVHLHNRNGFAPANALAAMVGGAGWLEASFLGMGGDAWFPGDPEVLGNYPTEDLIHLCEGVGVSTGVDHMEYMDFVRAFEASTGFVSRSFVTRGGTRDDLANAQWDR